jgi:hypothetical protein
MPGGFPIDLELCNGTDGGSVTASTAVTSCSTAWTTLIASTSGDTCWMEVYVDDHVSAGNYSTGNIGVGSAGNEVVIANKLRADGGSTGASRYIFPCSIPAGSRIAAQCVDGTHVNFQIRIFDGAFTQMEGAAGIDVVGYSGGLGTPVTPSPTANTKGSYAQLVASSARDYIGFLASVDYQNGATTNALSWLIDIAIGGAGNEQIIVPNKYMQSISIAGSSVPTPTFGPFFIPIPAGTRIAARCQAGGASAAALGLSLYGIYL